MNKYAVVNRHFIHFEGQFMKYCLLSPDHKLMVKSVSLGKFFLCPPENFLQQFYATILLTCRSKKMNASQTQRKGKDEYEFTLDEHVQDILLIFVQTIQKSINNNFILSSYHFDEFRRVWSEIISIINY